MPSKPKTKKIAPAGIALQEIVLGGTVQMMTNFSHPAYALARRLALEAKAGKAVGTPASSLPIAVVILAFTALESFVNEEIELTGRMSAEARPWVEGLQEARSLSLEAKWTMFLRLRGASLFDVSRDPYQSLSLLAELRNVLIHRAPRFYGPEQPFPSRRLESLARKLHIPPARKGVFVPWDSGLLTAECARWACNTAAAIRLEHLRLAQEGSADPVWEPIP